MATPINIAPILIQIAGEPLDQTVVQYGPFVMTTKKEVQDTLVDCKLLIFIQLYGLLTKVQINSHKMGLKRLTPGRVKLVDVETNEDSK